MFDSLIFLAFMVVFGLGYLCRTLVEKHQTESGKKEK